MTSPFASRVLPVLALLLLVGSATSSEAQTCRGMPRSGGIAFVRGQQYLGETYGATLSKGIIALGFNSLSSDADVKGWDGNLRFTVPLGGKVQFCPSIGIEYANQQFTLPDASELTARSATAAAGIGVGFEREITQGISLVPFVGADYHFNGVVFELDSPDASDNELSGDTVSFVNVQYGALVQFKQFYAGFVGDRRFDSDGSGLYRTKLMLGLSFGSSNAGRSASMSRSNSTVRASRRK